MVCFMNPSWYRIVSVNRDTDWSVGRVPSALSMPSLGIAVGCQHSGPAGRLGDAGWCQVRFHCPLIYHSGVFQPFPDSTDVSLQNTSRECFFQCSLVLERNQQKLTGLGLSSLQWSKVDQSRGLRNHLLGVTLSGWNALLTSGLFLGGNDVMVVSSWFLLGVFFCSGLSFWYAMIIAVVTVDKNIGCPEDDPFSKLTSSQNGGFIIPTSSTQSNLVYMLYHLETKYQTRVFFCCFLHYLWSKVSIYTSNNEASWKGRVTIPHWRR